MNPAYGLIVLLLGSISSLALCQEIYTAQDESGRVIFTNRGTEDTVGPVPLPTLGKFDPEHTKILIPSTCAKHGGVDCRAGADIDGSVICGDRFKESELTFLQACSTTRLEVVSFSGPDSSGEYMVKLRNLRDIAAQMPSIRMFFKPSKPLEVGVPDDIAPYSTAEIPFRPASSNLVSPLKRSDLWITCENCE